MNCLDHDFVVEKNYMFTLHTKFGHAQMVCIDLEQGHFVKVASFVWAPSALSVFYFSRTIWPISTQLCTYFCVFLSNMNSRLFKMKGHMPFQGEVIKIY